MKKKAIVYVFIVSLICFMLASYIEINKHFEIDSCFNPQNTVNGCVVVDKSGFSDFAGIPVSILGILAFFILAILSFIEYKKPNKKRWKIIKGIVIGTSLFAFYLIFAQVFLIKAVCKYCLIVDFLSLTMLIAIALD